MRPGHRPDSLPVIKTVLYMRDSNLLFVLFYLGWFALLGFVCYVTSSAMPLWALLLTPSLKIKSDEKDFE